MSFKRKEPLALIVKEILLMSYPTVQVREGTREVRRSLIIWGKEIASYCWAGISTDVKLAPPFTETVKTLF
jgi:hypothetical protein